MLFKQKIKSYMRKRLSSLLGKMCEHYKKLHPLVACVCGKRMNLQKKDTGKNGVSRC